MEFFGKMCFTVIALIISTIVGGYVFLQMWMWFILPVFKLPNLSMIDAIGLSFFVDYLKNNYNKKSDETEKDISKIALKGILTTIIWSVIILGLGYLLTLFR